MPSHEEPLALLGTIPWVWVAVTIILPALATPFLIGIFWVGRQTDDEISPMMTVKDGQLGWVTMALAASAVLETPRAWWLMYWVFGLAFFVSAIWAVFGATTPRPYPFPNRGYGRLWRRTFYLYLLVGVAFAAVHFDKNINELLVYLKAFFRSWRPFTS